MTEFQASSSTKAHQSDKRPHSCQHQRFGGNLILDIKTKMGDVKTEKAGESRAGYANTLMEM